MVCSQIGTLFPGRPIMNLIQKKTNALVVGGIQPEHSGEDGGGFVKTFQAPET
jgi:hypothetical protein